MSFTRYPAYKSSGVEWLGEVPKHWRITQIKHLLREGYDGLKIGPFGSQLTSDMHSDGGTFKVYGQENVISRDFSLGARFIDESKFDELSIYEIRSSDILITMMGTSGRCDVVPNGIQAGIMDSHLLRLRVTEVVSAEFLRWLIDEAHYMSCQIQAAGKGSIMHGLNSTIVKNLMVAVPDKEEQEKICNFLDRETAKIDALVAEQEKLITLLKEKRQAVISQAVTKGLDPTVPMKESGVEWLGKVPRHWAVTRLKFSATVQTGIAKGKDMAGKETITVPYLRVANVQDGYLAMDDIATIDIEPTQLDRYRLVHGDVLMNEGGDFDKLGRGAIWQGEIADCIHQNHVFAVRPHGISPDWLNRVTSSQYAQFYFMGRSKQSTNLASISSTNIMELPVLLPPSGEQVDILEFIDSELAKLDSLTSQSEQAVALLGERRNALISAAVTGQIDVRGLVTA